MNGICLIVFMPATVIVFVEHAPSGRSLYIQYLERINRMVRLAKACVRCVEEGNAP